MPVLAALYPPILEDTVRCFHNFKPGAISRSINALKEMLKNSERRRKRNGTQVHRNTRHNVWAKEFSQSGKCHFHVCFVFNEQAYNKPGDYNIDKLTNDDHQSLVQCIRTGTGGLP
ncbi:inovirus-type Gp2 protein [Serratia plymuthica]|nr:inovirus-type Gp2 protein [Serratia plymuthica]